jgi:predicted MPP superfamily phosphohydrolase
MEMVREINKLKKDLVVITGDIITGSVNNFWKRWMPKIKNDYLSMVIEVLGNLDGGDKIAVLGNHDQWDGKKTELRLVSELERVGIQVLRNSSQKLSRGLSSLYVAGTNDYWISCQRHGYFRPIGMIVHLMGCFTGVTNHLARRQYHGDAGGGLLADFLADCIHFSSIQGCQVGDDLFLDQKGPDF